VHLQGLRSWRAALEFVARKLVSDSGRFSGALFGAPPRRGQQRPSPAASCCRAHCARAARDRGPRRNRRRSWPSLVGNRRSSERPPPRRRRCSRRSRVGRRWRASQVSRAESSASHARRPLGGEQAGQPLATSGRSVPALMYSRGVGGGDVRSEDPRSYRGLDPVPSLRAFPATLKFGVPVFIGIAGGYRDASRVARHSRRRQLMPSLGSSSLGALRPPLDR
jgi:hypothetical protein